LNFFGVFAAKDGWGVCIGISELGSDEMKWNGTGVYGWGGGRGVGNMGRR